MTTPQKRRRPLALAALAVAAALIVSVVAWRRSPTHHDRLELRFATGTEYLYDLSWQTGQNTSLGTEAGGGLTGEVNLRGRLAVRAYGPEGEGWLVGMRFASLAAHEVEILGRSLLADDATVRQQVLAPEAKVTVARNGAIEDMRFEREAPELFKQLVASLLTQLDFRLSGDRDDRTTAWRVQAPGPFGQAQTRYERTGPTEVSRAREAYTTLLVLPGVGTAPAGPAPRLDSAATLSVATNGPWQAFADHERLRVAGSETGGASRVDAEVSLRLDLIETRQVKLERPQLAGTETRHPGEVHPTADSGQYALAQKAAGLTRADLLQGVSAADTIADINRWIWRATGLLQLEPALCTELGQLVATGRIRAKNAALTLDLLASAGTPAAQAALRAALSAPIVQRARNYSLLVQRMSLVRAPTAETAAFLGDLHGRDHAGASAYALGAVTGSLRRSGQEEAARHWNQVLLSELDQARSPRERALLLGALGNAGLSENVGLIVRQAASEDADVRAAAARALRKTDTPQARQTLHTLFSDGAAAVQAEALAALSQQVLDRSDIARLAEETSRSGVRAGNEARLVTLMEKHLAEAPEAARTLRTIAALPTTLPGLRGRIEMMLHRQRL